jgi:hypothetical protein
MRTTEKLTVTVSRPIAEALRQHAQHSGSSVSALTDRALRDFLLGQAMSTQPQAIDDDWLTAVAEATDDTGR